MKLADLAHHLGATLQGDPSAQITGVAAIDTAAPGDLTFVANPKYASLARTTKATAVLVEPAFAEIRAATLRIENPYLAFARAIELFYQPPAYAPGIHPLSSATTPSSSPTSSSTRTSAPATTSSPTPMP